MLVDCLAPIARNEPACRWRMRDLWLTSLANFAGQIMFDHTFV
jgi:hypothetical protein